MVDFHIYITYADQSTTIFMIIYSPFLVADENKLMTILGKDCENDLDEHDIETLQLIQETERLFEQRRRKYGSIFMQYSDSDDENKKSDDSKEHLTLATTSSSDVSTSTDSDSPYGSDSESSSSYDEYHAKRKIPKKKIHTHHKGVIKLYFKEAIGNWPKHYYKKYKRDRLKKRGLEINYENLHTKEIRHSLKEEQRERKKNENASFNLNGIMKDFAEQITFVSLYPDLPIEPAKLDQATSSSSTKTANNKQIDETSARTLHRMNEKMKKIFKRRTKPSNTPENDDDVDEQAAISSGATSDTSRNNELHKSNQSLNDI